MASDSVGQVQKDLAALGKEKLLSWDFQKGSNAVRPYDSLFPSPAQRGKVAAGRKGALHGAFADSVRVREVDGSAGI